MIAGILLLRGSLRMAGTVRWFGVIFLSARVAALLAWPAVQPIDVTVAQIRLNPGGFVADEGFLVFALGLFYWVITQLGGDAVLVASDSAGLKRRDMRFPIRFTGKKRGIHSNKRRLHWASYLCIFNAYGYRMGCGWI